MSRLAGAAAVLVVLVGSMAFAALNSGERVTLHLGVTTLYRLPVNYVAFGGLFLGMLVVLVAGIHADLKVRRILRERLQEEDREEKARMMMERYQRDLFEEGSEEE